MLKYREVLLAAFALIGPSACTSKECSFDSREPEQPVVSIECPSGQVCYQGSCKKACPQSEGSIVCTSDGDCPGALPFCVSRGELMGSRCSACEPSEACIPLPSIGICQPVIEIEKPPDPNPTNVIPPPQPLDAGPIDGYTFVRDAEAPIISPAAVTHVGAVIAEKVADFRTGQRNDYDQFSVVFEDVRTTTVSEEMVLQATGQCELILPSRPGSRSVASNLGDVRFNTHMLSPAPAVSAEINAQFDDVMDQYVANQGMSLPTLFMSDPMGDNRSASLFSPGAAGVTRSWPDNDIPYHMPYALVPQAATLASLDRAITVSNPPQDLVFAWEALPMGIGVIGGEKVSVEIRDGNYLLRCREIEGFPQSQSQITILSSIMSRYISVEMPAPGEERTIVFERVFEQQLGINGVQLDGGVDDGAVTDGGTTVINGSITISSSFIGTLVF